MSKYYVLGNQTLTASTLLLTLKRGPKAKPMNFQPGQYAVISFKQNGRPTPARCFSIVNSPSDHGILQCSIRKKGKFTNAAANLKEGDEVNVSGPFGGFVFDERRDRKMVLIAGGIGITPFMSMIQYATNNKLSNDITLIYNCTNQTDIPFYGQLVEIEERNPHFKIIFAISNGPTNRLIHQRVYSGRITSETINTAVNNRYDGKTFFICGPSAFMDAMSNILYGKGVLEEKVMTETFGQKSARKKSGVQNWPRNVYILGALGIVIATASVMASDLLTNLPVFSLFNSANQEDLNSTNSRQDELDDQINNYSSGQSTSTSSPSPTTTTTTTTAAPTKSAPVCTTSQSGVTTCV
ncbi:MAG: FAD-dependent oxidoreductase [Candidatus Saccharibacteria bacterium]|nr:FAD-dependent oxidoreductase [Candidatus Saccharibacteria bacterium]